MKKLQPAFGRLEYFFAVLPKDRLLRGVGFRKIMASIERTISFCFTF